MHLELLETSEHSNKHKLDQLYSVIMIFTKTGAIHLDDCPAERMIPIYLIVAGSFGAAKNLFSLVQRCRKNEEEREEDSKKVNPIEGIVNCFLFAWFIAGG